MKPYSTDIRTKVFRAYLRGEGSQRALAMRFDVSLSFVRDLIRLHRETGDVAPRHNRSHGYKHFKVDPETLEFLFLLLNQQPGLSLSQLCAKLEAERRVHVSRATLWRAIKRQRASGQTLSESKVSLHNPLTFRRRNHRTAQSIAQRVGLR